MWNLYFKAICWGIFQCCDLHWSNHPKPITHLNKVKHYSLFLSVVYGQAQSKKKKKQYFQKHITYILQTSILLTQPNETTCHAISSCWKQVNTSQHIHMVTVCSAWYSQSVVLQSRLILLKSCAKALSYKYDRDLNMPQRITQDSFD